MGEVYRGEQVSLKRPVAIKVLRQELSGVKSVAERFEREALTLSRLDHPGIVRVIDFGQVPDGHYLVMEFVAGRSLETVLREEGALASDRASRLLAQALDALGAAHATGVVHRDLKPENILLVRSPPDEGLKIVDFGIARLLEPSESQPGLTTAGMVIGTPEYMSPEQATGAVVDARSDLYSLGVIGYRMVAGRPPFSAPTPRQVLLAHVSQPAPPLVAPKGPVPAALAATIARALAKEPAERFASAAAMRESLLAAGPSLSSSTTVRTLTGETRVVRAAARRTVGLTVMLTDIKDFTAKTASQTREENRRMLALHDSLLMPVIEGFRGVRRKTLGDAFLVTFQSPTDAVLCGTGILDRLAAYNAKRDSADRIQVRVAISMGDVRLEKRSPFSDEADVIGEPLTVALALEDLAAAGEVWLSDAVYLAMNRSEAQIEEVGPRPLKGLRDPRRVYRVVRGRGSQPYGGRALGRLGELPEPSDQPVSRARRIGRTVARMLGGRSGG